jgi:hypothetical protein
MAVEECYLDTAYIIYLEKEGQYAFYYEDSNKEIKGLRLPKLRLMYSGSTNWMDSGSLHVEFENKYGSPYLKLRLDNSNTVCSGMSCLDYLRMIQEYSEGRQDSIYIKCKINNRMFEFSLSEVISNDGWLYFYADELNFNLNNSECPLIVDELYLYDNSGLRETGEYYNCERYLEVISGEYKGCPPSIPHFGYGNLNIGNGYFTENGISWGGYDSSVSNSSSTCYAIINGQRRSIGTQKDIYQGPASWRYLKPSNY